MFIQLPDAVVHAIAKLNAAGYEAYAVGGCVRDSLLGKAPTDWDITTSATPDEMQVVFANYLTIATGLKHGTLTVLVDETPLEITTYRIDGDYTDGRRPDSVQFTRSLGEDLRRRDFTVNAMAYHPEVGLVDDHNGQADLADRVIRCVGDPSQRFAEDSLRILRALRFSSVLGFGVDSDTSAALIAAAPTLSRVAVERIWVELTKLLCGVDAASIVSEYTDVLSVVIPEIQRFSDVSIVSKVSNKSYLRLAALFCAAELPTDAAIAILRRLHADTHTIECVKKLLSCRKWPIDTDADLLLLLRSLDADLIFDYFELVNVNDTIIDRVKDFLQDGVCYKVSMLAVNGEDMIAAGIPVGPEIGQTLNWLLNEVIHGRCDNVKEDLLIHIHNTK